MFYKIFKKIIFVALVSITSFNAYSQQQMQVNAAGFSNTDQPLQEKIFAHTDKDFYVAGEILWFKLYDVSSDSLQPLDLSNVAYVEILNTQQKPVLQTTIGLNSGSGNGSFYLNSSLTSGNYIFRAYTNWMKNFGADKFFQKPITIINTLTPVNKNTDNNSDDYEIGFYPEGGNLVTGLQSKVGFKATDKYGNGVDASVNIVDENNNTIATFSTLKFGMSSFNFLPDGNHTYTGIVNINNKTIKKALPAISAKGFVMNASNTNNAVTILVQTNVDVQRPVYLVAYKNNHISNALMQTTDNNGNASFIMQKNNLPAGITHVVLFNSVKQPVCERLIFIKPEQMSLNISADKTEYSTRSKVSMNLSANANADLSMSVYLVDSLQTISDNNILNYLWFASDLKGNVESPQYYFNNESQSDSALDNLLLTQGWSKFTSPTEQPVLSFAPEHEGHIIEGKVIDKYSGATAKNIRVYLSVPGKYFHFSSALSNDTGEVFFDIKDAYGSNEIVVQTAKEDSMYRVDILNPYSTEVSNFMPATLNFSMMNIADLAKHNLAMQVQNAFTINQMNSFASPAIDTTPFYGTPDEQYYLDNYVRFNTMEEVLREYVANVNVRLRQNNYSLQVVDQRNRYIFDNNPLVLVDGVPVLDMNKLMAYNPLKIKKADVIMRKYYLNTLTADGILSYSTYKGDLDGFQFDPGTIELSYDGLQLQRQFYSPQYATGTQQQSRLPDYRNTLYWSPQINSSNSQLSFYTSDVKGKYVVVVQGIDEKGKAGYSTTQFDVK